MIPHGFKYALLRLQRPVWVSPSDFDDAVNILRSAQDLADIISSGGALTRDLPTSAWLLRVGVSGNMTCWLRFNWQAPDVISLTVVVR